MDDDRPETIKSTLLSLEIVRNKSMVDLQKGVYRNYQEFVQVSKELAGFESKMGELKNIMNQLSILSDVLMPDCGLTSQVTSASS